MPVKRKRTPYVTARPETNRDSGQRLAAGKRWRGKTDVTSPRVRRTGFVAGPAATRHRTAVEREEAEQHSGRDMAARRDRRRSYDVCEPTPKGRCDAIAAVASAPTDLLLCYCWCRCRCCCGRRKVSSQLRTVRGCRQDGPVFAGSRAFFPRQTIRRTAAAHAATETHQITATYHARHGTDGCDATLRRRHRTRDGQHVSAACAHDSCACVGVCVGAERPALSTCGGRTTEWDDGGGGGPSRRPFVQCVRRVRAGRDGTTGGPDQCGTRTVDVGECRRRPERWQQPCPRFRIVFQPVDDCSSTRSREWPCRKSSSLLIFKLFTEAIRFNPPSTTIPAGGLWHLSSDNCSLIHITL